MLRIPRNDMVAFSRLRRFEQADKLHFEGRSIVTGRVWEVTTPDAVRANCLRALPAKLKFAVSGTGEEPPA